MQYDIFISYSRRDVKLVDRFVERLEQEGFRVWIDRKGIESGDSFKTVIVTAIEESAVFVYFNSAAASASTWTKKELGVATACGKPIIPVKLDHAQYSKEAMLDLINLDFIDYSDPVTRSIMMDKFVNVVVSKSPERWAEIQAERSGKVDELVAAHKKLGPAKTAACLLFPPAGLFLSYVSYKNKKMEKGRKELILSGIGFLWILLAVALLLIFRPFTSVPNKVTNNLEGDYWYFNVRGVPFTMRYVEGGSFMMGGDDPEADSDERPVHKVTLDGYFIAETEVTQELWTAVMEKKRVLGRKRHLPMELDDELAQAKEFIGDLNRLTGLYFRLPTEAEWEFAARGGNLSQGYLYSGSNTVYEVAYFKDNSQKSSHGVKEKSPNELGLYDMSGSVWELCSDYYGPYSASPQTNPQGQRVGSEWVVRGGSWSNKSYYCRVSYRNSVDSENDNAYHLGLRLAMEDKRPSQNAHSHVAAAPEEEKHYDERLTFEVEGVPFDMIFVQGATFDMGGESDADDALPIHKVTLGSYYIAETEVTQALWEAVMGTTVKDMMEKAKPSEQKGLTGVGDNYPMYYLNWYDCQEFIEKLNEMTGKTFRLPTEAQWEFAARGGRTKGYKYAGGNTLNEVAWNSENSKGTSHPVKQLRSNALGLYDMNGNVWEWCQDWYGDYDENPQFNPEGPLEGDFHVLRGASWSSVPERHGVAARNNHKTDFRHNRFGFRLVLAIDEEQ